MRYEFYIFAWEKSNRKLKSRIRIKLDTKDSGMSILNLLNNDLVPCIYQYRQTQHLHLIQNTTKQRMLLHQSQHQFGRALLHGGFKPRRVYVMPLKLDLSVP